MESTMHPTMTECGESRIEPCSRACTRKPVERGALANTEGSMELPSRHGRCPRGFSSLQIAILSVLKANQQIITYWQIAELVTARYQLAASEGAVRGALERMYRRGFLMRTRAAAGSQRDPLRFYRRTMPAHSLLFRQGVRQVYGRALRSGARRNRRPIYSRKER